MITNTMIIMRWLQQSTTRGLHWWLQSRFKWLLWSKSTCTSKSYPTSTTTTTTYGWDNIFSIWNMIKYRLFMLKSKQIKLWHWKHICISFKYMTYVCGNKSKMKVLYLLILPFPLLNGLFSNSTCQCTCHSYLKEPGDNHTYRQNSPASLVQP